MPSPASSAPLALSMLRHPSASRCTSRRSANAVDLKVNFGVSPIAAAQELAVDLGDASKNERAWHRACAWLDEQQAAAFAARDIEPNATAKAAAIRRAEHLRYTRE